MPGLYDVYNAKLLPPGEAFWQSHVHKTTKDRIKLSQGPGYDASIRNKTFGWDDEYIDELMEAWNDDILMEIRAGDWGGDEYFWDDLYEDEEAEDSWYNDDCYADTARDCIGWEEDMIKNGEF